MDSFITPLQSPTNQSRPKKTLIQITNIQSYSLDKETSKRSSSHEFISLGKKKAPTEPNEEQAKTKKKIILKERQHNSSGQNQCRNHKGRKAVNIIQNKKSNTLLCFECSVLEGVKGKNNQQEAKSNDIKFKSRQVEIQNYMAKSHDVEKNLRNLEVDTINSMQQFLREVDEVALSFKQSIQNQIRRLKLEYSQKAEQLKKLKLYQISQLNSTLRDIEKRCKFLVYNRIDVVKNMQDSLGFFSDLQYRQVMDKYWTQIDNSEALAKEHSRKIMINKFRDEINELLGKKGKNQSRQFTFSKEQRYESPQNCKLKGVPIISSNKINSLNQNQNNYI